MHLEKIAFNCRMALTCSAAWVDCPAYLELMNMQRQFTVKVNPTGLCTGVHFAEVWLMSSFFHCWYCPVWYSLLICIPVTHGWWCLFGFYLLRMSWYFFLRLFLSYFFGGYYHCVIRTHSRSGLYFRGKLLQFVVMQLWSSLTCAFGLIFIIDCTMHTAFNHWWWGLSCCHSLEQSVTAHDFIVVAINVEMLP